MHGIEHAHAMGSPIRQKVVQAAAKGVNAKFHAEANPQYFGGDAIVWGCIRGAPQLMKMIRDAGCNYWQMDNGYRGRNKYFRITKNAWQHVGLEQSNPLRWERLSKEYNLKIRPWNKGSKIVVAMSTEHLYKLHGLNISDWLEKTIATIKKHSDRKILVREKKAKGPIEDTLKDAHALVTYTSMAALDALQMGVPVFCSEKCAAAPMALQDLTRIEHPLYPDDRERLFWTMADHQFTENELASGMWYKQEDLCSKSSSVLTNEKLSLSMS
jgi:hypothetical protein